MNTLKITNKEIPDVCLVPTSKSYTNRALILAALNPENVVIRNFSRSKDVEQLVECLKIIGLEVEVQENDYLIKGAFPACEPDKSEIHLNAGQGGTTSRFLIALVALGTKKYIIDVDDQLQTRPIKPLVNALRSLGVKIRKVEHTSFPLQIQGPIEAGGFAEVDCAESTQFATALMLISHTANINIDLINKNFSIPYLNMTMEVLENKGNEYSVPLDFSSASYVIAYATLNKSTRIPSVSKIDKFQADSVLIELLNKCGGDISISDSHLVIKKASQVTAFDFDARNCPDLIPTLVYLALFASGTSVIHHLGALKFKESDRLRWIQKVLDQIGCDYDYNAKDDFLKIAGQQQFKVPSSLEVPDDHRIVMLGTIILKQLGGGEIQNPQAVAKSFPDFFEIFS